MKDVYVEMTGVYAEMTDVHAEMGDVCCEMDVKIAEIASMRSVGEPRPA